MFSAFGVMAIILAVVGTYAALAFAVKQRTLEIGVRMAIGATRADIVHMTLVAGMAPVLVGLCLGSGGSVALAQLMGTLVFGIAPTDVATLSLAAVVVAVTGCAACLVPALTAARVEPAESLRYE